MSPFKISLAAALAVSTMTTPLLAQSAAPLSIAGTARAGASVSGASQLDEDSLIPPLVLLAIMTAIIVLTGGGGNDDLPQSA